MRLTRASRLAVAVVLAGACAHNDVVDVITRDGSNTILAIDLATAPALPGGTRTVVRYLALSFDTAVADAFGRSLTTAAGLIAAPGNQNCYGTAPLVYEPGAPVSPA